MVIRELPSNEIVAANLALVEAIEARLALTIPRRVREKMTMYELYERGLFGNHLLFWTSVEQFENDLASADEPNMTKMTFGVRCLIPGKPVRYHLKPNEVVPAINELGLRYYPKIHISQMAPHQYGTVSCEICDRDFGLVVKTATGQVPMRTAFADQESVTILKGINARIWLRRHLDFASFEDIFMLLAMFPDHVIETTSFSRPVGVVWGRNTVVWEVRYY